MIEPAEQPSWLQRSRVEHRWAYGGVRVLDGKKAHLFITDAGTGDRLFYTSLKGSYVVGEIYRVTVSTTDDGHTMLHGRPEFANDGRLDDDIAVGLRGEHHAATVTLSMAVLHRKAATRDELDAALQPLRTIAARLRTRADRAALIAHIITALSDPPNPRP